jgi:hypothetical protein
LRARRFGQRLAQREFVHAFAVMFVIERQDGAPRSARAKVGLAAERSAWWMGLPCLQTGRRS